MKAKKTLRNHRHVGNKRWLDCYEFCLWSMGEKKPRGFQDNTFEEYVRGIAERGDMHGYRLV
jgi:hypothetical protein